MSNVIQLFSKNLMDIPKDTIIFFTNNSTAVKGIYRTIQTIDTNAVKEAYFREYPDQAKNLDMNVNTFIVFIIMLGYLEEIDAMNWNITDNNHMTVKNSEFTQTYANA